MARTPRTTASANSRTRTVTKRSKKLKRSVSASPISTGVGAAHRRAGLPVPAYVWNRTRGTILAERGAVLRNPLRQAIGTMFHPLPGAYVFVFPWMTRVAITNLFVFQHIDILWLDSNGAVTHMRERFPPFALNAGTPKPARYVIELAPGMIAQSGTRLGDVIGTTGVPALSSVGTPAKPF